MKSTTILQTAIAAAALGFASMSFAQDHGRGERHGRHDQAQAQPAPQHHQRNWQAQAPQRQYQQREYVQQYRQPQYDHRAYGHAWQQQRAYSNQGQWAGHAPRYNRGDVLPWQYRQRPYYVNDWRAHRLYAPPYGYQWVQDDGGDYLLVALATGLIANLLINSY